MKRILVISFLAVAVIFIIGEALGKNQSPATGCIASESGKKYYFNLFINSVKGLPMANGFLATENEIQYQYLPVANNKLGMQEFIDISNVAKIEVIPSPRNDTGTIIKNHYNTIKIYLENNDVISFILFSDLLIVTKSGRSIQISSRNPNHLILVKTK